MKTSLRLGLGIAAVFATGVAAVTIFGNHDSWFLRAAKANAVRCLTASPCVRLDTAGRAVTVPPPLTKDSVCAKPKGWAEVGKMSNASAQVIVLCADRAQVYLYHLGRLPDGKAGAEQWMACKTAGCPAEIMILEQRIR